MENKLQPAAPWLQPNTLDTCQIWQAMTKYIRTLNTPEAQDIQALLDEWNKRRRRMYLWP